MALYRIDDGSMKFLPCHQRNVHEILALCVSPNKKVIAVCEKVLAPEEGHAQVVRSAVVIVGFVDQNSITTKKST